MSASTVTSTPKKRGRQRINPPKRPHISDGALMGHFTIRREEVHQEECFFCGFTSLCDVLNGLLATNRH